MCSPIVRIILCAALSFIALPTWADDDEEDEHSGHHPSVAEEKSAAIPAPNPHLRLKEIEGLMSRIQASTDTVKRQEMLTEHLNAMRENMRLIRSHHAGSKMKQRRDASVEGDDAHSGHQESDAESGKGGKMEKKKGMMMGMMGMHKRVERRLDMLERMLQQLIEHEAVERDLEAQ